MIWSWSRQLEALLYPIGAIWLLVTLCFAVFLGRKRWGPATLTFALSCIIYTLGATKLPGEWLARLEQPYTTNNLSILPRADAVVMLGGVLNSSRKDFMGFNFGPAADRAVMAFELMRQHRAPMLVLGGGGATYSSSGLLSEGTLLEKWFSTLGLSTNSVISLEASENTHDEALKVKDLAAKRGWQRVILLTSASHMGRAEATFTTLGIKVTPVACDFEGNSFKERRNEVWFPTYEGFYLTSLYLHEIVGWQVYKYRGWIKQEKPTVAKG